MHEAALDAREVVVIQTRLVAVRFERQMAERTHPRLLLKPMVIVLFLAMVRASPFLQTLVASVLSIPLRIRMLARCSHNLFRIRRLLSTVKSFVYTNYARDYVFQKSNLE